MIALEVGGATAAIGLTAVVVVAWGAWLSLGSSRHGPAWALAALSTWRWMPWTIAALGLVLAVVVTPLWVGVGVAYIGLVSGWLMATVRRGLERVRDTYGEFHSPNGSELTISRRAGAILIAGALVLVLVGIWDVTVRGWPGIFGIVLAVCLGAVGVLMRNRSA